MSTVRFNPDSLSFLGRLMFRTLVVLRLVWLSDNRKQARLRQQQQQQGAAGSSNGSSSSSAASSEQKAQAHASAAIADKAALRGKAGQHAEVTSGADGDDECNTVEMSNLTIINFVLKLLGPTHERTLTAVVLGLQIACSLAAFAVRYGIVHIVYEPLSHRIL